MSGPEKPAVTFASKLVLAKINAKNEGANPCSERLKSLLGSITHVG